MLTMNKEKIIRKHYKIIVIILILIFAFLLRALSISKVFVNGNIHFIGFDSYYHMRRILFSSTSFPASINFDTYLNFPFGFEIGWPPLFDQVIALLAILFGFGSPDIFIVELTAAIFPLIIGILTFIPLYYITSTLFDKNVAILSVGILAILPIHIVHSLFGAPDHHIIEILLSTSAYAFFLAAVKSSDNIKLSLADFRENGLELPIAKSLMYAACAGIIFAISLLTWLGSPIFVGLIVIYAIIQFTFNLKQKRSSDYLNIIIIVTFIFTLILITPFILNAVRPGFELSALYLSWFQIIFVSFMIIISIMLGLISKFMHEKNVDWFYYPLFISVSALFVIILLKNVLSSLYISLVSGISYLIGSGKILTTISEAQPLFFTDNLFTFTPMWNGFACSFIVAMLALLINGKKVIKESFPPEKVFFIIWTLLIIALTLFQRRFMYLLSINVAILTGFFIINILPVATKRNSGKLLKKLKKVEGKTERHIPYWKIAIIFGLLILPNLYVSISAATHPMVPPSDWEESLNWLKYNTPETSYYNNASSTPEYGVMSWWDYGNWIVYLGHRPVITNNFQIGVDEAAKYFIETNESKANEILDDRNVRYVITDSEMIVTKFSSISAIAGEETNTFFTTEKFMDGNLIRERISETEKMKHTMLWSMHINDGANLGSIRLIHESNTTRSKNATVKSVKIFEYVKGATIVGFALPDDIVLAYTNVTSNRNRTFRYYNVDKANETGWYEIPVSYSTFGSPYLDVSAEPYTIVVYNSNISKEISIGENDVILGNIIRKDLINN